MVRQKSDHNAILNDVTFRVLPETLDVPCSFGNRKRNIFSVQPSAKFAVNWLDKAHIGYLQERPIPEKNRQCHLPARNKTARLKSQPLQAEKQLSTKTKKLFENKGKSKRVRISFGPRKEWHTADWKESTPTVTTAITFLRDCWKQYSRVNGRTCKNKNKEEKTRSWCSSLLYRKK